MADTSSETLQRLIKEPAPPIDHLPKVDDDYIQSVFNEMRDGMSVTLDENPLEYGPTRLNQKLHETRKYLDRCSTISVQLNHWLHTYTMEHSRQEAQFDLLSDALLTNDTNVRAGMAFGDRQAAVNMKLRDRQQNLKAMELVINGLEAVLKVVNSKSRDLKDAQTQLGRQMKLCEIAVTMGGQYGSAVPDGGSKVLGRAASQKDNPFKKVDEDGEEVLNLDEVFGSPAGDNEPEEDEKPSKAVLEEDPLTGAVEEVVTPEEEGGDDPLAGFIEETETVAAEKPKEEQPAPDEAVDPTREDQEEEIDPPAEVSGSSQKTTEEDTIESTSSSEAVDDFLSNLEEEEQKAKDEPKKGLDFTGGMEGGGAIDLDAILAGD